MAATPLLHMTAHPKPVIVRDPQFLDWIRQRRCVITGRHGVDACHVRNRRMYGDAANVVPMVRAVHQEQHRSGVKSFQVKHSIDLQAEADRLWAAYHQESE